MKKNNYFKAILALTVSHTLAYGMDCTLSGDQTSDYNGLDQSWIAMENDTLASRFEDLKARFNQIAPNFVCPTQIEDCLSGANILVQGAGTQGTLAHEIFANSGQNHQRLMELAYLANIPYAAEKGSQELTKGEELTIKGLFAIVDKLQKCKIELNDANMLNPDIISEQMKEINRTLAIMARVGIFVQDKTSTDCIKFKGLNEGIRQHLEIVDPLNFLSNEDELLGIFNQSAEQIEDIITYEKWREEMIAHLTFISESYKNKAWHRNIQNKLDTYDYTRGLGLKVLGVLSRSEKDRGNEFSTAIAANSDFSKIYVLACGTKSGSDWIYNNLNAFLTTEQAETGNLIGVDIHRGFFDAAFGDSGFNQLINRILQINPKAEFCTAGHSLGGAIATLLGLSIQEKIEKMNGGQLIPNQVKIFGAAAAMPAQKSAYLDSLISNINLQNMLYLDSWTDVVPIASLPAGYKQIGTHMVIPTKFFKTLERGEMVSIGDHFMKNHIHNVPNIYEHLTYVLNNYNEIQVNMIQLQNAISQDLLNSRILDNSNQLGKHESELSNKIIETNILLDKLHHYFLTNGQADNAMLKVMGGAKIVADTGSAGGNFVWNKICSLGSGFVGLFSGKTENSENKEPQ